MRHKLTVLVALVLTVTAWIALGKIIPTGDGSTTTVSGGGGVQTNDPYTVLTGYPYATTNQLDAASNHFEGQVSISITNAVPTNAPAGEATVSGRILLIGTNDQTGGIGGATNVLIGQLVRVDAINGNDSTGTRGDLTKPFLTVLAASAVLQAGDTLAIGPGTFAVGTNVVDLPDRCMVVGAGQGATLLLKTADGNDPAEGLFVLGASNTIMNLSASVTNGGGGVYGGVICLGSDMVVRNCKLSGFTDVFVGMIGGTNVIESCELTTRWDAIVPSPGNGMILVNDCRFYCPTNITVADMSFIRCETNWTIKANSCYFDGSNVSTNLYGLINCGWTQGSTAEIYSCQFASGGFRDIYTDTNSLVTVFGPPLVLSKVGGAGTVVTWQTISADLPGITNSLGSAGRYDLGRWTFGGSSGVSVDGRQWYQMGQGIMGADTGHLLLGIEGAYGYRLYGPVAPFNNASTPAADWSNGVLSLRNVQLVGQTATSAVSLVVQGDISATSGNIGSGLTVGSILTVSNQIAMPVFNTSITPDGQGHIRVKNDGQLYYMDTNGTESQITSTNGVVGDNLGNHTATQLLQMGGNSVSNAGTLWVSTIKGQTVGGATATVTNDHNAVYLPGETVTADTPIVKDIKAGANSALRIISDGANGGVSIQSNHAYYAQAAGSLRVQGGITTTGTTDLQTNQLKGVSEIVKPDSPNGKDDNMGRHSQTNLESWVIAPASVRDSSMSGRSITAISKAQITNSIWNSSGSNRTLGTTIISNALPTIPIAGAGPGQNVTNTQPYVLDVSVFGQTILAAGEEVQYVVEEATTASDTDKQHDWTERNDSATTKTNLWTITSLVRPQGKLRVKAFTLVGSPTSSVRGQRAREAR